MFFRFLIIVIVIMAGVWAYQTIDPSSITKENAIETFKKEKTINTVQTTREKRRLEAEKVMDQF